MNNPSVAPPSMSGSIGSTPTDDAWRLRTGLELARASQLTMLRLQLALHKSNRRTAMQALDNLLDIDAEMEELAAKLDGVPVHAEDDATLAGFIDLQRMAIATEKHALTGDDGRGAGEPIAIVTPGDEEASPDPAALPLLSTDWQEEVDSTEPARSGVWTRVFAIGIALAIIGAGLTVLLWPTLSIGLASL